MAGEALEREGARLLAEAEARLMGDIGAPDAKAAYALVEQSARLGHSDGRRAWVYLTAAGIGRAADPEAARAMLAELAREDRFAEVQLAFLDHMSCERLAAEAVAETLCEDPPVRIVPKLFSAAECRYLMLLGAPWLRTAMIIDDITGEGRIDPKRDAQTSDFPPLAEDLVVQSINRAIATATGTRPEWGEPLNILRYGPGQQYRPHFDAGGGERPEDFRHWTALIWLNEDYAGGETHFPELKLKVRGGVGDLLMFRNVDLEGRADPRLLHAGLPVTDGIKWMASRWIRSRDFLASR